MISNCPSMDYWHDGLNRSARLPIIAGAVVLASWIFGFGAWATLAPIDGAVVSTGSFVATGQNKVIQHLEGGIIRDILVKEGDIVEPGQTLVRLDDTAAVSRLRRLTLRQTRLLAMQARIKAEIAGADTVTYPDELLRNSADADIQDVIDRQNVEFQVRRKRLAGEVEVLNRERVSIEEGLAGFQSQLTAAEAQVDLFKAEREDKEKLQQQNLMRRTEVMAVQRAEARAVGDVGQLLGRLGDSKERIARAQQQIAQIYSAAAQRAVEELRATETELDDIREQIRSSKDVVDRIEIQAPVRGIVVRLNSHTTGGVLAPGSAVLELLPLNEELVLELRVAPGDVVHVKSGQEAQVRLSAVNQRIVPFLKAHVSYVSADAVSEQDFRRPGGLAGGPNGFVVRVRIDEGELSSKASGFVPIPGLPAEVFIKTGERTFAQYVTKPLRDSFARAFREQ